MYNSFVTRVLVNIWDLFVFAYDNSIIKLIADKIKKFLVFIFKGSIIKDLLVSHRSLISNSFFYRIYTYIINKTNKVLKTLNDFIKRIGETSVTISSINNLFKDDLELIKTSSLFILFFGLGIIGNNLLKREFSGKSYIVSFSLIIISIIILSMNSKIIVTLNNSSFYKFIKGIFEIDEGGENWW